ncbi:MAG: alcohol dehydrogenase catalytic domain-containing protein [Acidobacteria bacterium]|nr:alcohol dehydrogenase catalytic domain-containing protein [Acidobacteriota bacterium]
MKALRFEQGQLRLADLPLPSREGEALVRVTLAGICNTDVEIVRGYANFSGTLGHEFVGVVEDATDNSLIGQRVVGEINAGCGACDECLRNHARHCRRRNVLGIRGRDGAFAEYLRLPASNLLLVPDAINDHQAVFAEPLAAACAILEQVTLTSAHRVVVIGDGKLGQLIARVIATTGCDLTLIGKHESKLELARAAGVKAQALADVVPAADFDVVIEASGSASGLQLALDLIRPRGVVVLKSTFHGKVELDAARVIVNEIKLIGSRCGRFTDALALLADRRVNVEPLITDEFALADGVAAMNKAQERGVLKVLLRP